MHESFLNEKDLSYARQADLLCKSAISRTENNLSWFSNTELEFKTCITCGQHSCLHWTEMWLAGNAEGQNDDPE